MESESESAIQDPLVVRHRFASQLSGAGIEIGPGHVPFPVPADVTVRYVDRWIPAENMSLFPELGESPGFPEPDIVADLDMDRLAALDDGSEDFVIASHVIEHVANPIAILADCHRVLRPDGLLVLLVPDRHRTYDRLREPTPLSHLVEEYRHDVREVDDEHVIDYLVGTHGVFEDARALARFKSRLTADRIDFERRRSVHVHVWDAHEFSEVLEYADTQIGLRWEIVDTMPPDSEGTYGVEFGWLLSKVDGNEPALGFRRRSQSMRSRVFKRENPSPGKVYYHSESPERA